MKGRILNWIYQWPIPGQFRSLVEKMAEGIWKPEGEIFGRNQEVSC